ncbi:hypothetical protein Bca101_067518 [Brassica carinata]
MGKKSLTLTSIMSRSAHISSPPRLKFLASQNLSSLASTTEEHLPDFKSEKKTFELAMKKFREMKYSRDDYRRKKIAERFRERVWQRRYTYLFIGRGTTTPLLQIWNIIATTDLTEANRRNNLRLASVGFREVEVGNGP